MFRLRAIAAATGISAPVGSRIERGVLESVTFEQVMRMGAAVGLHLTARLYPAGEPIRDAAHRALIERLRLRLHPSLLVMTEVPLPIPGDRRAWDAIIRGLGWQIPVEAETRPRDAQAVDRRIALKLRDAGFDDVILLLLNSAHKPKARRERSPRGEVCDRWTQRSRPVGRRPRSGRERRRPPLADQRTATRRLPYDWNPGNPPIWT